jgi:hypothetical protein
VYKMHRETYHLTMDFIDRYLSCKRDVPKQHLQLIGMFEVSEIQILYCEVEVEQFSSFFLLWKLKLCYVRNVTHRFEPLPDELIPLFHPFLFNPL